MTHSNIQKTIIGSSELLNFPRLDLAGIPARIDTGAKTSSIWATRVREVDGRLKFTLFSPKSKYYTGKVVKTKQYERRVVASSNGATETRYVVKLRVQLLDRRIHASFTLANRSQQTYPVLVGRNVLRGKFVVDVKQGRPLTRAERERSRKLQAKLFLEENS